MCFIRFSFCNNTFNRRSNVVSTTTANSRISYWWSVIAYNPQNGAFGYGEGNMIKPAQNKALKDCALASTDTNKQYCQIVTEANHACVALATGDSPENMPQFAISE